MKGFLILALLAALLHQASCRQTNHRFSSPHLASYLPSQKDSLPMQPPHHAYSRLRHSKLHAEITPTDISKENDNDLAQFLEDIAVESQEERASIFKNERGTTPKKYQMRRGQQAQYRPKFQTESYTPEFYTPESYTPRLTQAQSIYFFPMDTTRMMDMGSLFQNENQLLGGQRQPKLMFSGAQTE